MSYLICEWIKFTNSIKERIIKQVFSKSTFNCQIITDHFEYNYATIYSPLVPHKHR